MSPDVLHHYLMCTHPCNLCAPVKEMGQHGFHCPIPDETEPKDGPGGGGGEAVQHHPLTPRLLHRRGRRQKGESSTFKTRTHSCSLYTQWLPPVSTSPISKWSQGRGVCLKHDHQTHTTHSKTMYAHPRSRQLSPKAPVPSKGSLSPQRICHQTGSDAHSILEKILPSGQPLN